MVWISRFQAAKNEANIFCWKGWRFATANEEVAGENVTPDPLHPDFTHLRAIYFSNDPDYTGRFTVPVLFDKKTQRIVSNEVR
jgi:glutathionyl-hydroquinone reductase